MIENIQTIIETLEESNADSINYVFEIIKNENKYNVNIVIERKDKLSDDSDN